MRLEGIHHVTAITGDAPANVDFYAGTLGLRLVKKSVNQDDPTVYHLFYGDEEGAPGNDITFFEYPGARPGRAGAGMVHRVVWRVASDDALSFWEERLGNEGVQTRRGEDGSLVFDPQGEDAWEARGKERGGYYRYDRSDERGVPGAGTVHHVAWASPMDEHEAWQRRVAESGAQPTPVIDRFYFKSIYF